MTQKISKTHESNIFDTNRKPKISHPLYGDDTDGDDSNQDLCLIKFDADLTLGTTVEVYFKLQINCKFYDLFRRVHIFWCIIRILTCF